MIQAAKDGDVKRLEMLVLQLYAVNDVKTADGKTLMDLAANRELPSKVIKFLHTIPEIMVCMLLAVRGGGGDASDTVIVSLVSFKSN